MPLLFGCQVRENESVEAQDEYYLFPLIAIEKPITIELFYAIEANMTIEQVHNLLGYKPSFEDSTIPRYVSQRWGESDSSQLATEFIDGSLIYFSYYGFNLMEHLGREQFDLLTFDMSIPEIAEIIGASPRYQSTWVFVDAMSLSAEWQDENANTIYVSIFDDGLTSLSFGSEATIKLSELENFEAITVGMTLEEVQQLIIAPPTDISHSRWYPEAPRTEISWRISENETFYVILANDIVTFTGHHVRSSSF